MIVYPDYIFFGSKPQTKDLPLWSETGYNVPATISNGEFSNGIVTLKPGGKISFTVSTAGYKTLAVVATSSNAMRPKLTMTLKIAGKPDYSADIAIPTSQTLVSYEIPAEYQVETAQLILQTASNCSKTINSAVLKV